MSKGDNRRPGKIIITCEKGHAMPDKWGKCVRCGEQIESIEEARARIERQDLIAMPPSHTAHQSLA